MRDGGYELDYMGNKLRLVGAQIATDHKDEWVKVSDRLPERSVDFDSQSDKVLMCDMLSLHDNGIIARYDFKINEFVTINNQIYKTNEGTHWLLLPHPPKEEDEEDNEPWSCNNCDLRNDSERTDCDGCGYSKEYEN